MRDCIPGLVIVGHHGFPLCSVLGGNPPPHTRRYTVCRHHTTGLFVFFVFFFSPLIYLVCAPYRRSRAEAGPVPQPLRVAPCPGRHPPPVRGAGPPAPPNRLRHPQGGEAGSVGLLLPSSRSPRLTPPSPRRYAPSVPATPALPAVPLGDPGSSCCHSRSKVPSSYKYA